MVLARPGSRVEAGYDVGASLVSSDGWRMD